MNKIVYKLPGTNNLNSPLSGMTNTLRESKVGDAFTWKIRGFRRMTKLERENQLSKIHAYARKLRYSISCKSFKAEEFILIRRIK